MKTLIKGGTIVNEGKTFKADLVIENDRIAGIPGAGIPAIRSFSMTRSYCRNTRSG